jgi:hypothetical protein
VVGVATVAIAIVAAVASAVRVFLMAYLLSCFKTGT